MSDGLQSLDVGQSPTMTMSVDPIGYVRSSFTDTHPGPEKIDFSEQEARIEVLPQYAGGLKNMSSMVGRELVVIFLFHKAMGRKCNLVVRPHHDETREPRGVFATRCNKRPNGLGLSTVKLVAVESETVIRVRGLDAVDGTPVVDIKPESCCSYQGSLS